jgi:hypothetical protein
MVIPSGMEVCMTTVLLYMNLVAFCLLWFVMYYTRKEQEIYDQHEIGLRVFSEAQWEEYHFRRNVRKTWAFEQFLDYPEDCRLTRGYVGYHGLRPVLDEKGNQQYEMVNGDCVVKMREAYIPGFYFQR